LFVARLHSIAYKRRRAPKERLHVPCGVLILTPLMHDPQWRDTCPTLQGSAVTLRELQRADALTLFTLLTDEQVQHFISPPPSSPHGFELFIDWAASQREAGTYVCFGVVPEGLTAPVGVFQLRQLNGDWRVAEWGFIIAAPFWGTGVFPAAAECILQFAFDVIGVHRIEARAAVPNGRGQGALRKLGAVNELNLRKSFIRNGVRYDQVMWSILAEEWRRRSQRQPYSRG
jgi:ribosomal-protein-alanine N-acetyltransferase